MLLFSSLIFSSSSYAESEEQDEASGDALVTVSGRLNAREIVYLDGTVSYEYLVMTDDGEQNTTQRYLLDFESEDDESDLLLLAGSTVVVEGFLQEDSDEQIGAAGSDSGEIESSAEENMRVQSMEIVEKSSAQSSEDDAAEIRSSIFQQSSLSLGTVKQVVVPARYFDIATKPHSEEYYAGQFYTDDRYSLAAYWRDASYGKFAVEGRVTHWVDLPQSEEYYLNFGGREGDLIAEADSQIDFDGPDNAIQNISPDDIMANAEGDDIDSVIAIYNGLIGKNIAGYGYLEPIRLTTNEGSLYAYFIAIKDTGLGSPVGAPSDYFVGLGAHEMGHNLGWLHTATTSCVHCDPWSIMGGGIYSELGPSGPLATHKDSEGWIEQEDIITITADEEQGEKIVEFTLDMLGAPTGENYLMAKVPFGSSGHYYTIEARKNVVNDHTPLEQTGLLVYHYSPTGHPDSMDPRATETIVDTTGIGDLENADIDVGDSFLDEKNKITITNLAQSNDTISVRLVRGDAPPDEQSVDCSSLAATIVGTSGSDTITGTPRDDVINGMGGNDIIYGLEGNDTICGGDGNDMIEGGEGDDLIFGNSGADKITGDEGDDEIFGGRGDDELYGGSDNDILYGWSGDDELFGEDGDDSLYGGEGDDFLMGGEGNDKIRGWLGNDTLGDDPDPA